MELPKLDEYDPLDLTGCRMRRLHGALADVSELDCIFWLDSIGKRCIAYTHSDTGDYLTAEDIDTIILMSPMIYWGLHESLHPQYISTYYYSDRVVEGASI